MFYSQSLLSRKGPLGTIWVAAHCHKRLKKDQVAQTNISSSVDTILLDGVPVVTYRILGYLLLGVVRIFSKKVEYLYHDFRHLLVEINDFAGSKKDTVHIQSICTPYLSITRPETFELDAFDLQIVEDGSGSNVRHDEDIMLADALRNEGTGLYLLDKSNWENDATYSETCSRLYTPVKDVLSRFIVENDGVSSSSHSLSISGASIEKLRVNNFSLEERLDPMSLCEFEEEIHYTREKYDTRNEQINLPDSENVPLSREEPQDLVNSYDKEQLVNVEKTTFPELTLENDGVTSSSLNLSISGASMEKLRSNNFSLEERLDPMSLCEFEEGQGLANPSCEKYDAHNKQINLPDSEKALPSREEESQDLVNSYDKEQLVNAEQTSFRELISPESGKCQIMKEHLASITIDVTPQAKCLDASGATTPDFMAVQTPATKEPARSSRKRKFLLDDHVVLSNKVLRRSIDDSTNLLRKRGIVSHSAAHAWRAHQISNVPRTFLEPLIPCISSELSALLGEKRLKIPEAVETVKGPEKLDLPGSPSVHASTPVVRLSQDETDIAPATPMSRSTSFRLPEALGITSPDRVGLASSCGNSGMELSSSEDNEFDTSLINEETNVYEGDSCRTNEWSARTRALAGYLCRSFLKRKKLGEEEILNLSQVAKRKNKSGSARLFYEILVLKTGGYIDVEQPAAYDDILVTETPKLRQTCEAEGVNVVS